MEWHDPTRLFVFVLILCRVGGIVFTAPVFGGSAIPMQVRTVMIFALSILILPTQWTVALPEPQNLLDFLVPLLGELVIGLGLGLGVNIFFSGVSLAGEWMAQLGGLSVSQIFDPASGENSSVLSFMLHALAVAVFASIGGLRVLMTALLDTFETMPPGEGMFHETIVQSLVTVLILSFTLALRMAAPVMVSVLVALIVMGILSRTMPQINIMSIGFGVNTVVMLLTFSLSLGAGIWCFQEQITDILQILLFGLRGSPGT